MILGQLIHILAAVVWVGGMFFALFMVRPAAAALEPPLRLALWRGIFARFFPWVWTAIGALLLSGFGMMLFRLGGFGGAPRFVHVMMGIGILMMLAFAHLFFAPWPRFRAALDRGDFPAAAAQLGQIRTIVTINLALGLIVAAIGATGPFWG